MSSNFQHYLESRTSKTSSDTIIREILEKVVYPDSEVGTSIYIHGGPATGKTTLGHLICSAVPDIAQLVILEFNSLDPKKKIVFADDVYDGGVSIEDRVAKLVGSGYLVFILAYSEPRIPVDHTVLFERYDIDYMGLHE